MWRHRPLVALLLAACLLQSHAAEQDVLVLIEDARLRSTHSAFLGDLRQQGWKVTIKSAADKTLRLRDWDDWLYGKIAIFASSIPEFGGAVDSESLLEFVDQGGNLLLAVDAKASDELRGLVSDLGVDLEKGNTAIDYQSAAELRGDHDRTLVSSDNYGAAAALFGGKAPQAPVLYRGAGLSVPPESSQVFAALRGTPSTVAASVSAAGQDSLLAGDAVVLVALMQARNNARVAISGSIDLFSNRFFQAQAPSGKGSVANQAFASAVAQWTFSQRAVLRASPLRHSLVSSSAQSEAKAAYAQPAGYRVSDEVDLALDIQELKDGSWEPYTAEDVQVEFVMLDPYVRTSLLPSPQGNYTAHIKVPDVYGVFKFVVDYQRPGFSHIFLSEQLPVRPFRHDEYERFLVSAYPYYASAASLMVAFLLLDFCLLYRK